MLKLMNIFCRGLWAVGFMLFCACGGSNGNVYKGEFRCEERPEPIRLVCEPLSAEIPGAVVGYVADSFYVAYTMMDPDYRIAVCDKRDMRLLGRFVRVGRGPDEYTYVNVSGPPVTTPEGVCMWFFSKRGVDLQLFRFNISRSLREGTTVIDDRILFDAVKLRRQFPDTRNLFYALRLDDSLCVCKLIGRTEVATVLYDYRAQEVVYRYDLCRQSAVVPNIAGGTIFADAAGKRFVEGSALLDQVNFWNRDGSGLVSVSTRRRPVTAEEVEQTDESQRRRYYLAMTTTSDRVLAFYLADAAAPPELHEFGWDGTLRNVYTFDFPVTSIACDEVTGDCYAFRSDSEIYRFRLSE
mgnify:FL=1|jgi:lipoprotein